MTTKVEFIRVETDEEIDEIEYKDGQLLYTLSGKTYMDYGGKRIRLTPIVELLTVDKLAPSECQIGDKYYNTNDECIYTAIAINVWDTVQEIPSNLNLYVDLSNSKLYYYDGTNFTSYGGGSSNDVVISSEEPTVEDWKLWINSDEVQNSGSEIVNEYSESTKVGYSADYVNKLHTYSTDEVRIGTYLDKPLYSKTIKIVFTIQYEENNTYFCWFNPNLSSINKIRNIDCYAQGTDRKLTSSGGVILNYMTAGNNNGLIQIGITKTLITNNTPIEITIEYTKTTD